MDYHTPALLMKVAVVSIMEAHPAEHVIRAACINLHVSPVTIVITRTMTAAVVMIDVG
jgi:hypothetical protein